MKTGLWTKDYTITTIGGAISVLGNALASFAITLFVFKETGSVIDFAIYLALFSLPQLFVPTLFGAWLDRFSNRVIIYVLDFFASFVYLCLALTIKEHDFNVPLFMMAMAILGTIAALNKVTFKSFYPFVIPKGFEKTAYSISSNIDSGSIIMIPLAAILYNTFGITPVLWVNCICHIIAAICEIRVSDVEKDIPELKEPEEYNLKHYFSDVKGGFQFLGKDKGLMAIIAYASAAAIGAGAGKVITVPWFIENFENGEYVYMSVWVFAVVGKLLATLLHSKLNFKPNKKFLVVLTCFLILDIVEGLYLHFSLWLMRLACFVLGFIEVIVHHLREHSLHHYIPKDMLARYSAETMLFETVGILIGELLTGILSFKIELIELHIFSMMFCAVCVVLIMVPFAKYLKKIYNI